MLILYRDLANSTKNSKLNLLEIELSLLLFEFSSKTPKNQSKIPFSLAINQIETNTSACCIE